MYTSKYTYNYSSSTVVVAGEDVQHAVPESASDSFSFPLWTTTGRGVRRTGEPQPTLNHCTWQSGREKHMYASRYVGGLSFSRRCVIVHQHPLSRFSQKPTALVLDETSCG